MIHPSRPPGGVDANAGKLPPRPWPKSPSRSCARLLRLQRLASGRSPVGSSAPPAGRPAGARHGTPGSRGEWCPPTHGSTRRARSASGGVTYTSQCPQRSTTFGAPQRIPHRTPRPTALLERGLGVHGTIRARHGGQHRGDPARGAEALSLSAFPSKHMGNAFAGAAGAAAPAAAPLPVVAVPAADRPPGVAAPDAAAVGVDPPAGAAAATRTGAGRTTSPETTASPLPWVLEDPAARARRLEDFYDVPRRQIGEGEELTSLRLKPRGIFTRRATPATPPCPHPAAPCCRPLRRRAAGDQPRGRHARGRQIRVQEARRLLRAAAQRAVCPAVARPPEHRVVRGWWRLGCRGGGTGRGRLAGSRACRHWLPSARPLSAHCHSHVSPQAARRLRGRDDRPPRLRALHGRCVPCRAVPCPTRPSRAALPLPPPHCLLCSHPSACAVRPRLLWRPAGELFDPISDRNFRFTERQASRLVRRLLDAIRCCHEAGVVHR